MRAGGGWRRYPMRLVSPSRASSSNAVPPTGIRPQATPTRGARSGPNSASPGPTATDAAASLSRRPAATAALRIRQPGPARRRTRSLRRCCGRCMWRIVEGDGLPDLPRAARDDADPLGVRGSADGHDDVAVVVIPRVGKLRQLRVVGGGEEAAGSDLNRELVPVPTGDPEVDVQPPRTGVGDVEEFAVVLATEIPAAAGAQVTFDQVCGQRFSRHEINDEACGFVDPLSRATRGPRIW